MLASNEQEANKVMRLIGLGQAMEAEPRILHCRLRVCPSTCCEAKHSGA